MDEKLRRKMTTAQRETRRAVERAMKASHNGVDFRKGHRMEMVRQAQAVRDAADELVQAIEKRS